MGQESNVSFVPLQIRFENLLTADRVVIEVFFEQKTNFLVKRNIVSLVTCLMLHFYVYVT